jgi:hypothetical protein
MQRNHRELTFYSCKWYIYLVLRFTLILTNWHLKKKASNTRESETLRRTTLNIPQKRRHREHETASIFLRAAGSSSWAWRSGRHLPALFLPVLVQLANNSIRPRLVSPTWLCVVQYTSHNWYFPEWQYFCQYEERWKLYLTWRHIASHNLISLWWKLCPPRSSTFLLPLFGSANVFKISPWL